jgi:hypothetical protein
MARVVKKWWTLKNVEWTRALVKCWNVWGCIGDLSKMYHQNVASCDNGDVWKLVFHHFRMLWLKVVLRKPNGEVGNKGFWASYHLGLFFKNVHVCCTMWLNLWGECLVQLGKKDVICLSQTPNDAWCSNREFREGFDPPPAKLLIYLGLHV